MTLTLKTPALLMILLTLVALMFLSGEGRRATRTVRTAGRSRTGQPPRPDSVFHHARQARPKVTTNGGRSREEMNDELREIIHRGHDKE